MKISIAQDCNIFDIMAMGDNGLERENRQHD